MLSYRFGGTKFSTGTCFGFTFCVIYLELAAMAPMLMAMLMELGTCKILVLNLVILLNLVLEYTTLYLLNLVLEY